ncbi:LuxR family transcriptional regulator [Streptomyces sp. SID13726]|uniref:helix-turn-helix transcriptional regulator n=1 Tax=Streptomyces sp. SID13726 TaxID=2706058 RepID=UPI0013BD83CE|nr:LuxR family transcriptional regulator [Streptomyces sp. SID13726]NEA99056.1 AAA family ATPase [Streptomyces sp. SID13726]
MVLLERKEELEFLLDLLDEAVYRHGTSALVGAAAAMGKSVLLETYARAAAEQGVLVLTAIACEEERQVPMGVMSQLLFHAPLSAGARAEADRLLAVDAGAEPDIRTTHALAMILLDLSGRRPLAVTVDNIHLADAESKSVLSYFARRIRGARVATVFTYSESSEHHERECADELLRQPNCHQLTLQPLSLEGVAHLGARVLGRQAPAAMVERCHRHTNGNPFLAHALFRDHLVMRRAGAVPCGDELFGAGEGYGRAVLEYLRRVDPGPARVAQAVAVLGGCEGVAALLDMCPVVVGKILDSLRAAGILTGDDFSHSAGASAVLGGVTPENLYRLNSGAADWGYHQGLSACRVARWLLAAGDSSAPWAVGVLTQAARLALSEGELSHAAACLTLARQGCAGDERAAARLLAAQLCADWGLNPSMCTPYLDDLVTAGHAGHLSGSDLIVLVKALMWHGRFDGARGLLPLLADAAGAADGPSHGELTELSLVIRHAYPALADAGLQGDGHQPDRAARLPHTRQNLNVTQALDAVLSRSSSQGAVDLVERVLGSAPLQETGTGVILAGLLTLVYSERIPQAAQLCDAVLAQSAIGESRLRHASVLAVRAEISLRQGALLDAAEQVREALRLLPSASWGVTLAQVRGTLVRALTAMGRHDEALAQLKLPLPQEALETRFGLSYLQARGRLNLATGHLHAALEDFETCGELMTEWRMDVPGLVPWRGEAAAVLLEMDEPERACKLAEDQLARADGRSPRGAGLSMRVIAATLNVSRRSMLLRQAADLLQGCGDQYELVCTLVQLTNTYHALGELRRARTVGRRAWNIARECHAESLVEALALAPASAEPAASFESLQSPDEVSEAETLLSEAERRVAELAALGYTNREISSRLYISVSTVEQHLTKTYRKLKVTRRSDLPSLVIAPVPGPS